MDLAHQLFSDTSVNITTDGRPYLGATVGCQAYVADYISSKVSSWSDQLEILASFAVSCLFSFFISKWLFVTRKVPNIIHLFHPLETCVCNHFIPSVTGRSPPSDLERKPVCFSCKIGWIGHLKSCLSVLWQI